MANALFKNIISYLLICSIFVTGDGFEGVGFRIYWYYPFYILFALYAIFAYHKFNVSLLLAFLGILIYSLAASLDYPGLLIKQIVNIGLSFIVFYYFIVHENFDLIALFRKYITVSKVVIVLGLVQVLLFWSGRGDWFIAVFPFLETFPVSERLQSVTQEPSFIAYTLAPVCFLALYNLFNGKNHLMSRSWSILFLIGYMLTLSSIAYLGLLLMLLLLYSRNFNYRKLNYMTLAALGIFLVGYFSYRLISFVKIRVDDTVLGMSSDFLRKENYTRVNLSTYAFLTNVYVTKRSLEDQPWMGNGLGTHEVVYDTYLPTPMQNYSRLNRQDADSLALRLMTELGIIGLFIFCYFIFRFRVRGKSFSSEEHNLLWILSNGIFILTLLWLFRNGNYAVHGKILFLFIYYFAYTEVKSTLPQTKA